MHRGLSQHRALSTNSASTVHLLDSAAAAVPKCQTMAAPGQPTALRNANHSYTMCTSALSTAHICSAWQSISVSMGRQTEPPQQNMIVVWRRWMGCDLHCCSHETKESSHCPVRRPEIGGKAHRHVCPVDGLSTQNTLRVVLYTVSIGRCLCTHVPCRFRGGMAIQRDALSTSTPPNTGAHVTVQSKYHTDSTTLIGVIGIEWRKPAILLPPTPAHPCPREQHGPSLGRVVLWRLGTHRRHHREQMGTHGGTARPEGFARGFAQGSKARCGRQDSSPGVPLASCESAEDNTLSHTRTGTPSPPVSNFEPHSHRAFGVFWTPQGHLTRTTPGLARARTTGWLTD